MQGNILAKWFQYNLVALAGQEVFRRTSWIYLRFPFDKTFPARFLKISSREMIHILGNFREKGQPITKKLCFIFLSSRNF